MARIDWPGLMRAGLQGLGLKPAEFWDLTPVELLTMLGIDAGTQPMNRERLAALAEAHAGRHRTRSNDGRS